MKWDSIKKQYVTLSAAIKRQFVIRISTGGIVFSLSFAILRYSRDIYLCLPCFILSSFLIANGIMLLYNCLNGHYICLTGVCTGVHVMKLRKKSTVVQMNTGGITVKITVKGKLKDVTMGDRITIYVSDSTPVYERDGVRLIYDYYVLESKKEA